jgi:hypothetical protein
MFSRIFKKKEDPKPVEHVSTEHVRHPRMHDLPPIPTAPPHHPVKQLDSLRASIEATIEQHEQRSTQKLHVDVHTKASSPFYAANGAAYHTLQDFFDGLQHMDDYTFHHHANDQKNDFASWIEGCFTGEAKRIAGMLHGKTRQEMIRLLSQLQKEEKQPIQHQFTEPVQHEPVHPTVPIVHHTPLPESPLHMTPEKRVKKVVDAIHAIQEQAATNPHEAREAFIEVRTHIWQELTEDERRHVLPKLREVYDILKTHH